MGVIVTFDVAAWRVLFPQFSNVDDSQLNMALGITGGYVRNDGGGPVQDVQTQTNLLNLMLAHVVQLLYGSTTQPLSPLVGRVNSAGEGSVNVGVEMPMTPTNAWYMQTQYGAMFWQMSAVFRTMRYAARPTVAVQPAFGGWPRRGGW